MATVPTDPRTLLFYDPRMIAHEPGRGHVENPARLQVVVDRLQAQPISGTQWRAPTPATRAHVERLHDPGYIDVVDRCRGISTSLDPDVHLSPDSTDAAYLAVGAAIDAVTAVVTGQARNAFAFVRPPGHHAEAAQALGFCMFANVALAAEHARAVLGVERVLILDWDVHHGNGTEHLFAARDDVLVVNLHQSPLYPGTGALGDHGTGPGEGFTINAPLPPGLGDGDYHTLLRELLPAVADTFKPDLVLISAGFDAHRDDPLGSMNLTSDGFASLCGLVSEVAATHAEGRLVLVLEGGYHLDALAASVHACTQVLAGHTPPPPAAVSITGEAVLRQVLAEHRRFWPV